LAHAARRSEELQDPTWHAARLPAAGTCLGECTEIELIAGAAQDGRVLQPSRMLSSSCVPSCFAVGGRTWSCELCGRLSCYRYSAYGRDGRG